MKKRITSLALALLIICSVFSLAACSDNQGTDSTTAPAADNITTTVNNTTTQATVETMTLVIGTETPVTYSVDLGKVEITDGLMSVLEYLKTTENLEYTSDDTGYGAFLTKVGALEQKDNSYIYLYTSVEKDMDVSQYATSVDFEGKTLTSSGVGASEMTVEDGCIIYVGTVTF